MRVPWARIQSHHIPTQRHRHQAAIRCNSALGFNISCKNVKVWKSLRAITCLLSSVRIWILTIITYFESIFKVIPYIKSVFIIDIAFFSFLATNLPSRWMVFYDSLAAAADPSEAHKVFVKSTRSGWAWKLRILSGSGPKIPSDLRTLNWATMW